MNKQSNVRSAPAGLSPVLVERLLSLIAGSDAADASATEAGPSMPRLRLGAPSSTPVPALRAHPLQRTSEALAYLRHSGTSVSVAETSHLGTRWWVSGHPLPLDAAALIELATANGFAAARDVRA